jgi:RNA polymerase-binding protein DksA
MAAAKKTTRTTASAAESPAGESNSPVNGDGSTSGRKVGTSRKRKAPAPRRRSTPLTARQIERYRKALLAKRRELLSDVDHMQNGALDNSRQQSSGDLSNMPIHMADIGTDNYEQEFTLGLLESERRLLRDIDDALAKIENGGYGICEGTGEPITRARLDAKPEARYCIEYARLIEAGKARDLRDSDDDSESRAKA